MFSTTETIDSEAMPGAKFTLKRIGIGLRLEVETKLADKRYEQYDRVADYRELVPEGKKPEDMPMDVQRKVARLNGAMTMLQIAMDMEWTRAVTSDVILPDGSKIPIDQLLENGDGDLSKLVDEISGKIKERAGLSADETKNSQRPTTSQESGDGPIQITTASTVNPDDSTSSETVESSSQAT